MRNEIDEAFRAGQHLDGWTTDDREHGQWAYSTFSYDAAYEK